MLYSELERSFSASVTRGGWRELRARDTVSRIQNERELGMLTLWENRRDWWESTLAK